MTTHLAATNVLEWNKVQMTLQVNDRKTKTLVSRTILDNLEGTVYSGQLVAIMGPTGCGKSSFMNILAGKVAYNKNIKLHGNIFFNSMFMEHGLSCQSVGYVAQDETSFAFLTVRETLTLSAYFHSPPNTSKQERDDLVEFAMRELSLAKAADTILGNESRRGVSGGEYRRVLIGKELIKKPEIVFLDEPTSGLDAYQALAVMETLKNLVQRGRIVISVIHQPRSSIFALFDRLLLLSEGKLIYYGPADLALEYFKSLGYQCPTHFNPADYFLDILSIETKTVELESTSRQRVNDFAIRWKMYSHEVQLQSNAQSLSRPLLLSSHKHSDQLEDIPMSKPCSSWCSDFFVLMNRSFKNIYRNYGGLLVRGITTVFFAVLVSLIYRDLTNDQRGIQNRAGLLYFILINQGFSPLIVTLNNIPPEKLIINREVTGGSYRYSSYYLGRVLAELPNQIVLATVYCIIIYWSTGLYPSAARFFLFLVIILLTTLNACALGFLVSSISPSADVANAIGPPVFIILLLYGGFYINASSLPVGSIWVRYLSLVYWGFQALIVNEFAGQTFTCTDSEATGACITTGEQEIAALSFSNASVGVSVGALIGLTTGFFLLGYIGLLLSKQRYCRIHAIPDAEEAKEGEETTRHKEQEHKVSSSSPYNDYSIKNSYDNNNSSDIMDIQFSTTTTNATVMNNNHNGNYQHINNKSAYLTENHAHSVEMEEQIPGYNQTKINNEDQSNEKTADYDEELGEVRLPKKARRDISMNQQASAEIEVIELQEREGRLLYGDRTIANTAVPSSVLPEASRFVS